VLEEFEADRGSAGERSPVDDARTGPKVAANRLEHQEAARLPKPLGGYAGAARTDILRGGSFGAPSPAQVSEFDRLGQDGSSVPADAFVGSGERFPLFGTQVPPSPFYPLFVGGFLQQYRIYPTLQAMDVCVTNEEAERRKRRLTPQLRHFQYVGKRVGDAGGCGTATKFPLTGGELRGKLR